jgi:hypothetical protein
MSNLPTPEEMIANADWELSKAYRALGDAADWLRSDWKPSTSLTPGQVRRVARMRKAIADAKSAINEGR